MEEEIKNIIEATSMGELEKKAVLNSLLNLHSVSQCDEKVCWWRDRDSKHDVCDHCTGECNWHGG